MKGETMDTTERDYVSPSQIGMYFRCGLQYQYRYLEGIKIPPAVAMILGRGGHRAIEADLTAKIDTGELLPTEAVLEIARDATDAEFQGQEPELNEEEKSRGRDAVRGATIDSAVLMVGAHHVELAPTLNPTHVERKMAVLTPDGFKNLLGIVDIVEPNTSRDTKFKGKSPNAGDADTSMQLTFYSLASHVIDGVDRALCIDAIVKTPKGKDAKVVTLETSRDAADWQRLIDSIKAMQKGMEAGIFFPAEPGSWVCSERWCGYWQMCNYGRKQRTVK